MKKIVALLVLLSTATIAFSQISYCDTSRTTYFAIGGTMNFVQQTIDEDYVKHSYPGLYLSYNILKHNGFYTNYGLVINDDRDGFSKKLIVAAEGRFGMYSPNYSVPFGIDVAARIPTDLTPEIIGSINLNMMTIDKEYEAEMRIFYGSSVAGGKSIFGMTICLQI